MSNQTELRHRKYRDSNSDMSDRQKGLNYVRHCVDYKYFSKHKQMQCTQLLSFKHYHTVKCTHKLTQQDKLIQYLVSVHNV